jgi:hypothetical protein
MRVSHGVKMRLSNLSKSLLLMGILVIPTLCLSKEEQSDDPPILITDYTYRIGSGDSKEKYKALGLYGAKRKAVILSAKYLADKNLLENFGKKQKEIFCLASNEVQATIIDEKYFEYNKTYYIKIRVKPKITDFIKAEIKNFELERKERNFSWQEEMEQFVYTSIDPAQELSRAYRYIRKRQWRIAIIYLDHLGKKYPNWSELYLTKAIGFYGMHDIERMRDALKISCSLGNQEACKDLERFVQSDQKDLKLNAN